MILTTPSPSMYLYDDIQPATVDGLYSSLYPLTFPGTQTLSPLQSIAI